MNVAIKAVIVPATRGPEDPSAIAPAVNNLGNLTIDAPSIAGKAKRNAKSAATDRDSPRNIPKLIETPKRDIPAKRAVL